MKVKKKPMRMCTGCGTIKLKTELVRIVKTKENSILVDSTGKVNGRGAYICNDISCLNKAIKSKRIEKNLEIKIDEEILKKLNEEIVKDK